MERHCVHGLEDSTYLRLCNSCQTQATDKLILKFIWKDTGLIIAQTIFKKKEYSDSNHSTIQQSLLYSYSNQDSVVLLEGWAHRSLEQNREPSNRPIQICPTDFQQRCKSYSMKKGQLFQQTVLEQLDIHRQKK